MASDNTRVPRLPTKLAKTGVQARMVPLRFRQHIQGQGQQFRWSRAVLCTCFLNNEDIQADPTCDRCNGDGWQYVNPLETAIPGRTAQRDFETVTAVMSTLALDPDIQQPPGGWTFGKGLLTVPDAVQVSYRDRFIAIDHLMGITETLVRLDSAVVPIGKAKRPTSVQLGSMSYEPVCINFIASADRATGVQTIYYPDTDFTIRDAINDEETHTYEPAKLVWQTGRGPSTGQSYVIHYSCRPVWLVDDATYSVQTLQGPNPGLSGTFEVNQHPTTFSVVLDYLPDQRGSTT